LIGNLESCVGHTVSPDNAMLLLYLILLSLTVNMCVYQGHALLVVLSIDVSTG